MADKKTKVTEPEQAEFRWPFGKRNYILFAAAIAVIIAGYVSLDQGSISLAPVLLVIGYCVLVPLAIIIRDPEVRDSGSTDEIAE